MKKRVTKVLAIVLSISMLMPSNALASQVPSEKAVPLETIEETTVEETTIEEETTTEETTTEETTTEETTTEEATTEETTVSENIVAEKSVSENKLIRGMFPGMPDTYKLSEQELQRKKEITSYGMISDFGKMAGDVDYKEKEVIYFADSVEYAEAVAAAYNGKLKSFEYGVAVAELLGQEITVVDAVSAAADTKNNLPAVYTNHVVTLNPPSEDTKASDTVEQTRGFSLDAPKKQSWQDYKEEQGVNMDPFLDPTSPYFQWMHDMVGSYGAWGATMGNSNIKVAVLDSGIRKEHMELEGQVLEQKNFSSDASVGDLKGHGTHCAGIIAAKANNARGCAGIAPDVKLLDIKVLNSEGSGTTSDIIKAIEYVYNNGAPKANIVSMSLGNYYYHPMYGETVKKAIDSGMIIVAAAGNDGSNTKCYPASYPGVIGVASVTRAGARSTFSNWGPQVTIAAPGSSIWSLGISGNTSYSSKNGTSMATPVVSGVIALYLSERAKTSAKPADMNNDGVVNATDVDLIKKELVKTATPAASPNIGKIVNAENLINPIVTTPIISVKYDNIEADIKNTITKDKAKAYFYNTTNYIIYTLDGSNPTTSKGMEYDAVNGIDLSSCKTGKVTLKAISVNGLGAASKTSTTVLNLVDAPAIPVNTIAINGSANVGIGKSYVYKAVINDGQAVTNANVTWEVYEGADKSIQATIDTKGKLTVKAGTSDQTEFTIKAISASNQAKTATYKVKARKDIVGSISIGSGTLAMVGGGTQVLEPSVKDSKKVELNKNNYSFEWISSNPKVAVVDQVGKVSGIASGSATITCKVLDGSGKSATRKIAVTQAVTAFGEINTTKVAKGKQMQLSVPIIPETATNKTLKWEIMPGDATGSKITPKGLFKAGNNAGEVTVKITAADASAFSKSIKITVVENPIGSMTLSNQAKKITLSDKFVTDSNLSNRKDLASELTITLQNNIAGSTAVVWTTSNEKVATVSKTGSVEAKAPGKATITAKALDGSGKLASSAVTVITSVESLIVEAPDDKIAAGTTMQLKANIMPAKPTNKGVKWKVDGTSKANGVTVSTSGKLSVPAKATVASISVIAEAADGSGKTDDITIYVRKDKVTSVSFASKTEMLYTRAVVDGSRTLVLSPTITVTKVNGVTSDAYTTLSYKSSNDKVATVSSAGMVTAQASGTATITAEALDGSGKKGTVKITVREPVGSIEIAGSNSVEKGKSISFKATVFPADASVKGVEWDILGGTKGASISSGGVLKIDAKKFEGTEVKVRAASTDGAKISSKIKTIKVNTQPISAIHITAGATEKKVDIPSGVKNISLFTLNTKNSEYGVDDDETKVKLSYTCAGGTTNDVAWSTSNPKVATVSASGEVKSVGAGSAKITCAALNGSNKKVTCNVSVVVPASGITIRANREYSAYSEPTLNFGKSLGFSATPGNTYGKVTNTKVTWSYNLYEVSQEGKTLAADTLSKYVVLSKSGKLEVKSQLRTEAMHDYFCVELIATAQDGSGVKGTLLVDVVPATTYVNDTLFSWQYYVAYLEDAYGYIEFRSDSWLEDFTITSSNPDIIAFEKLEKASSKTLWYVKIAMPGKTGKATIKIVANDSGKYLNIPITVKASR